MTFLNGDLCRLAVKELKYDETFSLNTVNLHFRCAPEGLEYRRFTTKGDVWSYGVTVWEIFSLGKRPILCEDFREMLDKLRQNTRLDRPTLCPEEFFEKILLEMCWIYNEENRADLPQVYLKLREYIAAKERESSPEEASSASTETTDQTQSLVSPNSVSEAAANVTPSEENQ
jgi:serine/threonine protein kinase